MPIDQREGRHGCSSANGDAIISTWPKPKNLVLLELWSLRRDFLAGQEAVALSLNHLKAFAGTLDELASEFETFRVETRDSLREIRSDLLRSDNNALNRHNDLLNAMERVRTVEEQGSILEKQIDAIRRVTSAAEGER